MPAERNEVIGQCATLEFLLALYMTDRWRVTEGERTLVEHHLNRCSACRIQVLKAKLKNYDLTHDDLPAEEMAFFSGGNA